MQSQKTYDYLLRQVSVNNIENNPKISAKQKQNVKYNIAIWINFKAPCNSPLTLELRVQDNEKIHQINIDRALSVSSGQVLFSGQIGFKCEGHIHSMQILLVSREKKLPFITDEIFIQKAAERPTLKREPKKLTKVA